MTTEPPASGEIALTELERDALTELVNIGVSRAAASLRQMVGQQVMLSVPSVELVSRREAAALITERESDELIAVQQDFSGAIAGRAMLIFPRSSSLELMRAVVGDALDDVDAAEMEHEALAETGNVILNGCLGTVANLLRRSLQMSLPSVTRGPGSDLFAPADDPDGTSTVLFLYINFSVRERDIRGYIAMLMKLPSMTALRQLVQEFIASVMDDDTSIAT